jgi:MATE family multidrug resistance protein
MLEPAMERADMHRAPASALLPRLLSLSWPVVVARATQSVIGFSDVLLVSPLGEESVAAVGTGALNTFCLIILPMGTSFILQSFAAQLRGRGDLAAAGRYAWYGLILAFAAGIAAACAIPAVPFVLHLFGHPPGVERAMALYVSIRLLSVGAVVGTEALGNWYGGRGNTRVAMIAGATAMVVNVLGCYALVQPRFGLPGYGVAGAGWSSVLATWSGFAVVLFTFARDRAVRTGPRGKLRASELVRVLRFGLPNGVNWFLEFFAFFLFVNVVTAHLGTTALASFNVVIQINSVSFMPAWGVSTAGAILVGETIGKGAKDDVWPIVRLTGAVAIGWMVSVGLLYLVAPATLIGVFAHGSDALVVTGTTMLTLSAVWQLFDGLGITLSEALRAAGDTFWPMAARITLAWGAFLPGAWFFVMRRGGGVATLMLLLVGYLALLSMALAWRFASGRWRAIELVEPNVDAG